MLCRSSILKFLSLAHSICYPIGAVLGGLAAAANQWLRDKNDQYKFDPVHDDELDEDY